MIDRDWTSPPGDTIRDAMDEMGIAIDELTAALELPRPYVTGLLAGSERITPDVAARLEQVFGEPAEFWLRRDEIYLNDISLNKI
jgi:addiction module HigA family antidote